MGDALGQLYVKRDFSPQDKSKVLNIALDLISSFRAEISRLGWLKDQTRKEALAKLASLQIMVGYPDVCQDYSSFRVVRGPYVLNFIQGNLFEFNNRLSKIGKPIDEGLWLAPATPSTSTRITGRRRLSCPPVFCTRSFTTAVAMMP